MQFMDLLFSKYASPFLLLDGYIQTCRFCEFVDAFCKQKQEDDRWEFFLHRVWNKSYREFCEQLDNAESEQGMTDEQIEATVKTSMNILNNFNPKKEEGGV